MTAPAGREPVGEASPMVSGAAEDTTKDVR